MSISTHVLDTALGRPAVGLTVEFARRHRDDWVTLTQAATDEDGRVGDLLGGGTLEAGTHRIRFDTGTYHEAQGVRGFYPEVCVVFEITEPEEHHHVPLLLSPYAYSTYRGS